eukprot:GEZU01022079.1.p1 GENE.GEZU01022079.1~~GEZU01022079.1.p1  ORF type:complete len:271 (-),score=48.26 GEZU01022079.1:97-909(-)
MSGCNYDSNIDHDNSSPDEGEETGTAKFIGRGYNTSSEYHMEGLQREMGTRHFNFRDYLNRIVYSKFYFVFYMTMIALTMVLLIWTITKKGHPSHIAYYILDGLVTLMLVLEVAIFVIIEKKAFFKSFFNWFDLLITVLCVIAFLFFLGSRNNSLEQEIEDIFEIVLLVLRYGTQTLRIVSFICNFARARRKQKVIQSTHIDLNIQDINSMQSQDETHEKDIEMNAVGTGYGEVNKKQSSFHQGIESNPNSSNRPQQTSNVFVIDDSDDD